MSVSLWALGLALAASSPLFFVQAKKIREDKRNFGASTIKMDNITIQGRNDGDESKKEHDS